MPTNHRPSPLALEVEELERRNRPGCDSSTTSPRCTCRPTGTFGAATWWTPARR